MIDKIIPLLERMTFDDITDFIDYAQYYVQARLEPDKRERDKLEKQARSRRSGKDGALPYLNPYADNLLTMTTDEQRAAIALLNTADKPTVANVLLMANALQRAKAPERRKSQGNIQLKRIPYEKLIMETDPETNQLVPALDEHGNRQYETINGVYLYVRYWQIQGDKGKKSRVKSVYVGGSADFAERRDKDYEYPYRALAWLWDDTMREHGIERTRTHTDRETGERTERVYYVRPKDEPDNPINILERAILACIDMTTIDKLGSDAIDHNALLELQAKLT